MQKFIRIALPCVCFAVIIGCFKYDIDLRLLIGAAGICGVSYAILYVKLHKIEHRNQLKAEEAAASELERVKGNSLKKEMVKHRLVREYAKKLSENCVAIENIKGWLSSLKWSLRIIGLSLLLVVLLLFVAIVFSGNSTQVPTQIDYHNADDLRKATGVKFPEIIPVDSLYSDGGLAGYNTNVKFVSVKPLDKKFFQRLDQACKTDSCCWSKDSTGYIYDIYPEAIPFDRTKGMHQRMVDDGNGKKVPDWDGTYISVFVPIKGDSIILDYGWVR
mgnify:FL=1